MSDSALPTPRLPDAGSIIDGAVVPALDGATRDVHDPATGTTLLAVAEGGRAEGAAAVAAARRAFDAGGWSGSSPQARARTLERVADLLARDAERFAHLETLDTGKPSSESRDDLVQVEAVFRYYAALLRTQTGDVNPVPAGALSLTLHRPAGVVVMITPWNYPLLQASWKVAPGLASGCCFVLKPSELTPLTTLALGALLLEAGVPPGVANVVTGAGGQLGSALVNDERIDMISFTGGLATGRGIARSAADRAVKVALELGGKNPNIVLADADLDVAVDRALDAVFFHAGQVCSAGSRLLVDDAVHDEVVEALIERVARIRVGFGWEEGTEMGPLISHEHRDKVEGYVALAQEEGAELRLGGRRPQNARFSQGSFLEPTILTGLPPEGRVAREEIFGPVLTVERFSGLDEALARANATDTGLAAAIWTRDVGTALAAAGRLRFGTVWWNDFHPYFPEAPWGGFKTSGVGRELGRTGLREYQEEQHVYLNLRPRLGGAFGMRERP
ncbi:MAG: aldehyde dehydrogenase family protein [Trueperaceae bacterium]|nr:aldehyde dehydrogenase family protein [Trueperaceae bacterium]